MSFTTLMVLALVIVLFAAWKMLGKRRKNRKAVEALLLQDLIEQQLENALDIQVELLCSTWDRFETIAAEILDNPYSPEGLRADARAVILECSEARDYAEMRLDDSFDPDVFLAVQAKVKRAAVNLMERCNELSDDDCFTSAVTS